jgi:hypothetical protein
MSMGDHLAAAGAVLVAMRRRFAGRWVDIRKVGSPNDERAGGI